MEITASHLTTSGSGTNTNSYSTASVAPAANRLILIAYTLENAGGQPIGISSVSGLSLSWTQIGSTGTGPLHTVYYAVTGASAPTPGVITITMNGTQNLCRWSVSQFANVDLSDPIVQSNFNASAGVTNISATLSAFSSAQNATFAAYADQLGSDNVTDNSSLTILGSSKNSGDGYIISGFKNTPDTSNTWTGDGGARTRENSLIEIRSSAQINAGFFAA